MWTEVAQQSRDLANRNAEEMGRLLGRWEAEKSRAWRLEQELQRQKALIDRLSRAPPQTLSQGHAHEAAVGSAVGPAVGGTVGAIAGDTVGEHSATEHATGGGAGDERRTGRAQKNKRRAPPSQSRPAVPARLRETDPSQWLRELILRIANPCSDPFNCVPCAKRVADCIHHGAEPVPAQNGSEYFDISFCHDPARLAGGVTALFIADRYFLSHFFPHIPLWQPRVIKTEVCRPYRCRSAAPVLVWTGDRAMALSLRWLLAHSRRQLPWNTHHCLPVTEGQFDVV